MLQFNNRLKKLVLTSNCPKYIYNMYFPYKIKEKHLKKRKKKKKIDKRSFDPVKCSTKRNSNNGLLHR